MAQMSGSIVTQKMRQLGVKGKGKVRDQLCFIFQLLSQQPKLYSITMKHLRSFTEKQMFNAIILFIMSLSSEY